MAKGVEVHSSKWIRKQSQNVKELLKLKQRQLLNLLDYDVSLLLMFNRQSNVAVVESAVSKEKISILKKIIGLFLLIRSSIVQ